MRPRSGLSERRTEVKRELAQTRTSAGCQPGYSYLSRMPRGVPVGDHEQRPARRRVCPMCAPISAIGLGPGSRPASLCERNSRPMS